MGLTNLDERCRAIAGRGIVLRSEGGRFEVEVPLLAMAPPDSGALLVALEPAR